jgi:flavin-binding protein dodecin
MFRWAGRNRSPAPAASDAEAPNNREVVMAVARVTKITASSTKSFQDAVEGGLKRASKTLRGITGLEVISLKAKVDNGKVVEYRATIELTFILD